MKAGQKQLTKKEQKAIVTKTQTGKIPNNVGFPGFNINSKSKAITPKTTRKRG